MSFNHSLPVQSNNANNNPQTSINQNTTNQNNNGQSQNSTAIQNTSLHHQYQALFNTTQNHNSNNILNNPNLLQDALNGTQNKNSAVSGVTNTTSNYGYLGFKRQFDKFLFSFLIIAYNIWFFLIN